MKLYSSQEGLRRSAGSEIQRRKEGSHTRIRQKEEEAQTSHEKRKESCIQVRKVCGEEQVQRSKEKRKWSLKKTSRGKS